MNLIKRVEGNPSPINVARVAQVVADCPNVDPWSLAVRLARGELGETRKEGAVDYLAFIALLPSEPERPKRRPRMSNEAREAREDAMLRSMGL